MRHTKNKKIFIGQLREDLKGIKAIGAQFKYKEFKIKVHRKVGPYISRLSRSTLLRKYVEKK